jgi:hypothetical protein
MNIRNIFKILFLATIAIAGCTTITSTEDPCGVGGTAGATFGGTAGATLGGSANGGSELGGQTFGGALQGGSSTGGAINAPSPKVLYTDIVSGPISGGENNKGIYLSLFGYNFGTASGLGTLTKVFINNVEVDNYRYLGVSKGRTDIQQITVQVGAIGNPVPGVPLPIKVEVNGVASNVNNTFTVQPGDILFVSKTGNDSTAVKNDINHPWRYLQTSTEGGAYSALNPGDVIVVRGGDTVVWNDVGFEKRWIRFRRKTGTKPNGIKGNGYIAILAYPNEYVHYVPPASTSGGIHGVGDSYPEFSDWIVVSGLHIESAAKSLSDGAPVNLQVKSDHWRVVNNELGPWPAANTAADKAAGVVGNGTDVVIFGNNIHNIGGGTENHGIYIDTGADNVDIGYNIIRDVTKGNLIQFFDNLGTANITNVSVHHNVIKNGGRYGLNISEGIESLRAWNNVISDTAFAGIRFNITPSSAANIVVVHNTVYNTNLVRQLLNAPVANDWNITKGFVLVENNIFMTTSSSLGTDYFLDNANASALIIHNNLWYGRNLGHGPPEDDASVGGNDLHNPMFISESTRDFSLQSNSPAINQASIVPFTVTDDYKFNSRPNGTSSDVGAFEF